MISCVDALPPFSGAASATSARATLSELLRHPLAAHWPSEFRALLCVGAARLRQADGQAQAARRWLRRARVLTGQASTLREIEQLESRLH